MDTIRLTKQEAREYMVQYHMINTDDQCRGMDGILAVFDRLQSIQYDPLNVVGTNPELVLQSRVIDFKKDLLDQALYQDRVLIDAWDKQMSIYQTKDFPLMSRIRKHRGELEIHTLKYRLQLDALKYIDEVLSIIKEKGPIFAKDINIGDSIKHKWGQTKPSSATLDYLFQIGKIGVYNKKNTMKQYDLMERLTHHLDTEDSFSDDDTFIEYYLERRMKSMGLVSLKNGVHFSGLYIEKKENRVHFLTYLINKGIVTEIEIESLSGKYYVLTELLHPTNKLISKVSFLAPLDNLIWDRNILKDVFEFEYTWEVYTPKSKHKYGYYVLPILYGSQFIGRIEFEIQRNSDPLKVKNIWYEEDFKITKKYENELDKALKRFATYLGANDFNKSINE
ncbi:MAG: winged helix DNA-binding domain-containing protein [Acholeplasmataceae bacterium]|nr:winged helix DNA-binding domain-containing protein [Acholeplasmataceae bacterium]